MCVCFVRIFSCKIIKAQELALANSLKVYFLLKRYRNINNYTGSCCYVKLYFCQFIWQIVMKWRDISMLIILVISSIQSLQISHLHGYIIELKSVCKHIFPHKLVHYYIFAILVVLSLSYSDMSVVQYDYREIKCKTDGLRCPPRQIPDSVASDKITAD